MDFGIDTFTAHLDQITWTTYATWSGGTQPAFAGRSFLGGDFIWAPAEGTNAFQAPSPGNFATLTTWTPLIAPIQGADGTRQQVTGDLGVLYGQIDGEAICKRLSASITNGELTLPDSKLVHVYLQVDTMSSFSADYWAGWADMVVTYASKINLSPDGSQFVVQQPFRPCIMCLFDLNGVLLLTSAQVSTALTLAASYRSLKTQCYGFWADAADIDQEYQEPNPAPDFTRFSGTMAPVWLWRFATTLKDAGGNPISPDPLPFSTDAADDVGTPAQHATDFMLGVAQWQPALSTVQNWGFSVPDSVAGILAQLPGATTPSETRGESCGTFTDPGGEMKIVGRYARESDASSVQPAETTAISATKIRIFTAYERSVGPTNPDYYNTVHHNGLADAKQAFRYVAEQLHQPPHSTVFFAFDWAPPATTVATIPAPYTDWLTSYMNDVHQGYETYLATHPNRPYRIGFYGAAVELALSYTLAFTGGWWQSDSMCNAGNAPPNWPWPHATRWQTFPSPPFQPNIGGMAGQDLDNDWGDGGDWSVNDFFNVKLTAIENQQLIQSAIQSVFGFMLTPP